ANQFAGTGLTVVPGIELDNPDANINGGNISILTPWNLGAAGSNGNLAYRFNGQAPIITFKAENNVDVKASLTDGFFQIANPLGGGGDFTIPALSQYGTYTAANTLFNAPSSYLTYLNNLGYGLANTSFSYEVALFLL